MTGLIYDIGVTTMAGTGRIFGLDDQLLFDLVFQGIAVFILFFFVGNLLINPIKKVIMERQEKIKNDVEDAARDRAEAAEMKAEYDEKIKNAEADVAKIMSDARTRAVKNESIIINEAKEEAGRIIENAEREARLEKLKVKDETRTEIISVAYAMAGKILDENIDTKKQEQLLEETLAEIGEDTWRSE